MNIVIKKLANYTLQWVKLTFSSAIFDKILNETIDLVLNVCFNFCFRKMKFPIIFFLV